MPEAYGIQQLIKSSLTIQEPSTRQARRRGRRLTLARGSGSLVDAPPDEGELVADFPLFPNPNPRTPDERAKALLKPGFGVTFSDHMALMEWTSTTGWENRRVVAYAPFQLDPAAMVLHYAQEIFEGLKAYAHADGSVWCFRPEANAARMAASARRLGLPEIDPDDFLAAIKSLVKADQAWVPTGDEQSLYLRPFMFGTSANLAVKPADEVTFCVIASPSDSYFATGVAPVSIWLTREYTRAAAGGTGAAKCGGNYAASMVAQAQARENGCDQVAFVDATEHRYLEELGGMNIMVLTEDGELHTPSLSGTILPGVTRDALLALATERELTVVERRIEVEQLLADIDRGRVKELFACGTAAIITPIRMFKDSAGEHVVADGLAGSTTLALRKDLTDLQYGRREDTHGWLYQLA